MFLITLSFSELFQNIMRIIDNTLMLTLLINYSSTVATAVSIRKPSTIISKEISTEDLKTNLRLLKNGKGLGDDDIPK